MKIRSNFQQKKSLPQEDSTKQYWRIHGRYYDLSSFVKLHPGGISMIRLGQGRDCTELFESIHNLSAMPLKKMLQRFLVQNQDSDNENLGENFSWEENKFFDDVSRRVRKYFADNKLSHKATRLFYLWSSTQAIVWIIAFFGWIYYNNIYFAVLAAFLGMSLCFSVFHTASHHALSRLPWVNDGVTLFLGGFSGFLAPLWMEHHVVGHHCYTGIHRKDPDLGNAVLFMRKSLNSRWNSIHRIQSWTALPFLILFPGQWAGQTVQYVNSLFTRKLFGLRLSSKTFDYMLGSILIFFGSLILHLVVPLYLHGVKFLPSLLAYTITFNFTYWSIVFPNHDTTESNLKVNQRRDWGEQQVSSSLSYYQPHFISQFFGGMNYQIEHHLFPSVSPCHYPAISKIVRDCCKDHGIYYPWLPSWRAALMSYLRHLSSLQENNHKNSASNLIS